MKHIIFLIFCILLSLPSYSQWNIGVRYNRYIYGSFTINNHYLIALEQSVYSDKIGFQSLRTYTGYITSYKSLNVQGIAFYGSSYNKAYWNVGASINVRCLTPWRLFIDGELSPFYDSAYKYSTTYLAGLGVVLSSKIDFFLRYTNIPEYRMSENRVHVGFRFHVGQLSVQPVLSVGKINKVVSLRPLIGFNCSL